MDKAQKLTRADLRNASPQEIRNLIRSGDYRDVTSGLARGYTQVNLVVLPGKYAEDFHRFCQRNPKPCPLLSISEPGAPRFPELGPDIDIRSDISSYNVFRNGELTEAVCDVSDYWTDDMVGFALGCSFTFEEALEEAGLTLRHNAMGKICPMYTTNIDANPAGPFNGKLVVTMRAFPAPDAIRAIQVTSRFPGVHGAPIHIGDPAAIGIADLDQPEFGGDRMPIEKGEIPLFWACGVTPQLALKTARPEICITHTPACMLITDVKSAETAAF
ncbi:hypothetical protein AB838_22065 [Rhodobacteraceae bacterium (ex Bugula neritina AB1)]|nr:hypothetical protein AB838_22065 [Rhodobacteraceae bacterium (ex Bugula neritina AB1)]